MAAYAGNDIVGHVIAGYQGWFTLPGDGSPVGNLPAGTGNYHDNFETYPDLREFPDRERFPNLKNWGTLPNGNSAMLFSSARAFTAEKHAQWMQQYGIEVAAIQRFFEVTRSDTYAQQKNLVTRLLRDAYQRNGRKFYIEYDASGSGRDNTAWIEAIQKDWNQFAVAEGIHKGPAYARQNRKPVVELWGMGLDGNNIATDPASWLALVKWFQKQGCYVIGGVPTGWAKNGGYRDTLPGFEEVYAACDAINPWIVGRFGTTDGADRYAKTNLAVERDWCKARNIDYIPCVFPGTSFYNSDNRRPKNIIPRQGGKLLWQQFANLRNLGISTCFVAMFDEFNEATAIMKSAENTSQLPADKWFLPLDADGVSLSSDFYLRLTRDAGQMLKGKTPLQWTLPTPAWDDLFATGFETGQPQPVVSAPAYEVVREERMQSGSAALRVAGTAGTATRHLLFDYSAAPKTITRDTLLYYWLYPENENARFIALDFHCTDGTTLQRSTCVDQNGHSLRAAAGHGGKLPLRAWSVITSSLGALTGKKIDKIFVVFDRPGASGPYRAYLDDIRLSR